MRSAASLAAAEARVAAAERLATACDDFAARPWEHQLKDAFKPVRDGGFAGLLRLIDKED